MYLYFDYILPEILFSISVHECAIVNEEAILEACSLKSSHIYTLSSAKLTTMLVILERFLYLFMFVSIYVLAFCLCSYPLFQECRALLEKDDVPSQNLTI